MTWVALSFWALLAIIWLVGCLLAAAPLSGKFATPPEVVFIWSLLITVFLLMVGSAFTLLSLYLKGMLT